MNSSLKGNTFISFKSLLQHKLSWFIPMIKAVLRATLPYLLFYRGGKMLIQPSICHGWSYKCCKRPMLMSISINLFAISSGHPSPFLPEHFPLFLLKSTGFALLVKTLKGMERVAPLKPITDWVADGPGKLQFNVFLKRKLYRQCLCLFCQLRNRYSYLPVCTPSPNFFFKFFFVWC